MRNVHVIILFMYIYIISNYIVGNKVPVFFGLNCGARYLNPKLHCSIMYPEEIWSWQKNSSFVHVCKWTIQWVDYPQWDLILCLCRPWFFSIWSPINLLHLIQLFRHSCSFKSRKKSLHNHSLHRLWGAWLLNWKQHERVPL